MPRIIVVTADVARSTRAWLKYAGISQVVSKRARRAAFGQLARAFAEPISSRPNRATRKSMNSRTFTDKCRVGG
ncbi:hypothetical protein ACVMAJ_006417 [Bradyrhizobium sp. USDA 4448]